MIYNFIINQVKQQDIESYCSKFFSTLNILENLNDVSQNVGKYWFKVSCPLVKKYKITNPCKFIDNTKAATDTAIYLV